ncbi:MAG: DEAD/DEAH box helicase family protein [Bacteroidales bacterium]|nr:DEAD/DEAH box helicase family protein [Bacteroidales bacterium]
MPKYTPKKFQQKAIDQLVATFKKLWQNGIDRSQLVFKSPTGSGKTFMVCNFVDQLNNQPDFEQDIAFVWVTFSDDLAMQSKDKFYEYYFPNISNQLLTVQDFSQGVLKKNDIMFLNWQKLVSKKASDRVLRRPENDDLQKEQGFYFEDIAEKTHTENRRIVMIIDESHKNVTASALRDVINPLNPKIIVKVSATPEEIPNASEITNNLAGYVEVSRQDVVAEGLIKEEIVSQTEDDLNQYTAQDHDTLLLDLAIDRRQSVLQQWQSIGQNVNPLVLIQLPNDDKKLKDTGVKSKEEIVTQYLTEIKKIDKNKIAYWFDNRRENMDNIADNDCPVEYMLFKQAAGTGWDCPRAHILVMYREIKSNTFKTQTLGRILRMPVMNIDLSSFPDLKTGFLYTNYQRNEVQTPGEKGTENRPKTIVAKINTQQKINFATKTVAKQIQQAVKQTLTEKSVSNDKVKTTIKSVISNIITEFSTNAKTISETADNETDFLVKDTKIQQKKNETTLKIKEKVSEEIKKSLQESQQEITKEEQDELDDDVMNIVNNALNEVAGKREAEFELDSALKSDFISRIDYGDIGKASEFQEHFLNFMCNHFSVNDMQNDDQKRLNLQNHGLKLDTVLEQDVMVNARFKSDIDDSVNEFGKNIKFEMSDNDVEKEFAWRCYETVENLPQEYRIGNIARSWGPLKEALRQWFKIAMNFYPDLVTCYKVFLNDLHKGDNSIMKNALNKCFQAYKPLLEQQLRKKREQESKKSFVFKIKTSYSYADDYKPFQGNKSIVQPFYLPETYDGRDNETDFIKYLDSKYDKIEWWFKNGVGKDFLAFKFTDSITGKEKLFYPDWIVLFNGNRIGIFDTKGGITAQSPDTKDKAEELQRRIRTLNATSRQYKYIGGIVEKRDLKWLYNDADEYVYENNDDWKEMEEVF